jgi:hypothetical protein
LIYFYNLLKGIKMSWTEALQELSNKFLKNCVIRNNKYPVVVYAADGAISTTDDMAKLTKSSAGAYTLAAPTAAMEGHRITIFSGSAFAHVLTATNLLDDGVTGGAKDTATFAAFVGASITLIAADLKWIVEAKNVVTVAAV